MSGCVINQVPGNRSPESGAAPIRPAPVFFGSFACGSSYRAFHSDAQPYGAILSRLPPFKGRFAHSCRLASLDGPTLQCHIRGMSKIKTVCVYCGSGPGTNPLFVEAAIGFGKVLAENGVRLVYGGGSFGLMGAVAKS